MRCGAALAIGGGGMRRAHQIYSTILFRFMYDSVHTHILCARDNILSLRTCLRMDACEGWRTVATLAEDTRTVRPGSTRELPHRR